ncbi:MAG TPA: polyphosphate kinase 2 family protein [Alphaproteobacteria bacterium]|jgi:PPK2 family polyphosphate:nucleotide phosphotransferase|nr:polyphosphate kinase 2 family protein [Alphaproteobacteria bacterium]
MKIKTNRFRVSEDETVRLKSRPTLVKPVYRNRRHYRALLDAHVETLSDLQKMFFADKRFSLLLVLQAMDAAGKDGVIRHVMSGVNPQGCRVTAFRPPSEEELLHDFLWRAERALPARGQIGIFNRSYYEEVLVPRVHPEILKTEGAQRGGRIWRKRNRSIQDFERHLSANGTHIVKIFLHVSKGEQRDRFVARIDDPDKNWKLDPADIKERACWKDYRRAYERCISATSSEAAPWYIVPADDKRNARLIVSQIVLDALRSLKLEYPSVSAGRRRELVQIRADLVGGRRR